MLENADFEQKYCSRTAESIYEIGHDCIRLLKWLIYYDRSFCDNMNFYDLMASIVKLVKQNLCLCYCTRV